MKQKKILIVEDDPSFGSVLKDYLLLNNYSVNHAIDGDDGIAKFKHENYDLCILDIMMPKKDGFTLGQEIKEINPHIPIIYLTAKSLREDVLKGYKTGAVDYLTKPFDTEVLLYKIQAIISRSESSNKNITTETNDVHNFRIGRFNLNSKLRILTIGKKTMTLSPKENKLLHLLCVYVNDLMPRELALTRIWNDDNYFTSRSMDVYIAKLRKYLKEDPSVEIINIHGEGFRLVVNTSK